MSVTALIDEPVYWPAALTTSIGTLRMDACDVDYAEFVRSRTHALLRSAYLLTGDQHLAEDLVQEALARTHRAWARLERDGNAEAYTRKVMYHAQVSHWRRRKVAEVMSGEHGEHPSAAVADPAEAATRRITLQRALLGLSPKQRAVIVLRFYEDRTEAEAAEMLGVSVGTIKSQCARGLARLRTLVPDLRALDVEEAGR